MRALLLLTLVTAAADGFAPVERKDWVADWDRFVMRSTLTATGRLLKFLTPAPRARREILLRPEFEAQVADGRRRSVGSVGTRLLELATAGPLKLAPLEVVDLAIDDTMVRAVELAGESVMVYWTLAKSRHSILYVQGRHPGHATLRVQLTDGTTRLVPIDVP